MKRALNVPFYSMIYLSLKDNSEVGIIVDYSRDYTIFNGIFFNFFSFNLRSDIFQSAKKCETTLFPMTSFHVDLNEAAKFVDIIQLTFLASLSHLQALVQNTNWRRYLA